MIALRTQSPLLAFAALIGCTMLGCEPAPPALEAPKKDPFPGDWFIGAPDLQLAYRAMHNLPPPLLQLESWPVEGASLADLKGKIVLIDFWGAWCKPCLHSIPTLNDMHEKYAMKGLVIIGVCDSFQGEKMEAIAEEHHIRYPIARDLEGKTHADWRIEGLPTYAIIDRDGTVRAMGLNPIRIEQAVRKVLMEH